MRTRLPALAAGILAALLFAGFAFAQAPLVVISDIVAGHEGAAEGMTCTKQSRFAHEQQVVWRTKVVDPATGEFMDDSMLASVTIMMPDGEAFEMAFGGHPGSDPVDYYWTYDWVIPMDYPTGVVEFTVEAVAADGRTGMYSEIPIESSMLTITEKRPPTGGPDFRGRRFHLTSPGPVPPASSPFAGTRLPAPVPTPVGAADVAPSYAEARHRRIVRSA